MNKQLLVEVLEEMLKAAKRAAQAGDASGAESFSRAVRDYATALVSFGWTIVKESK